MNFYKKSKSVISILECDLMKDRETNVDNPEERAPRRVNSSPTIKYIFSCLKKHKILKTRA